MMIPTYPDLTGKIALVTGGSRGIGRATCRLLAANRAKVVVSGRDQAAIAAVVSEIQAEGGGAIGVAADCTDASAIDELREHVERELGPVELLAVLGSAKVCLDHDRDGIRNARHTHDDETGEHDGGGEPPPW